MPIFTFACEHTDENGLTNRMNTVEFSADTWPEVVDEMTDFLRGCGYHFSGELQMVDEESEIEKHSKYYFDFDRNR